MFFCGIIEKKFGRKRIFYEIDFRKREFVAGIRSIEKDIRVDF